MGLIRLLVLVGIAYLVYRIYKWVALSAKAAARGAAPTQTADPARLKSPYEVLGVNPDASADDIRAAYQRMVRQYHPDRVADLGPELRNVAERRTKEINAAYAKLKRVDPAREDS